MPERAEGGKAGAWDPGQEVGGAAPPGIRAIKRVALVAKPQALSPAITCADTCQAKAQLPAQRAHILGPPSFTGKEGCLENLRAAGRRGSESTPSHQGPLLRGTSSGLSFQLHHPRSSLPAPQWGRTNHICLSRLL